ncbi:MAG: copper-binding protein [Terriglobales bacterium]
MDTRRTTLVRLFPVAVALLCLPVLGCNHSKQANEANLKHYRLTGSVVAIDKPNKSLTVDGDEVPGFMSAMQMPYDVKDVGLLDKLAPGDHIAADIVVKDDESWLENIKVTQPSAPEPKPTSTLPAVNRASA